jgi:hypothetical protein
MGIRVDLSGAKSTDTLIDKGTYLAVLSDGEVKESKSGPSEGNPTGQYVHWEFTLKGGQYDTWKQWKNTPLGGDGVGFLKEVLSATGKFSDEDLSGEIDFEFEDVLGSEVLIAVRQREYPKGSGEYVNDIGKVKPFEGDGSLLP